MTQEKADLINRLMDVEDEIQVLWDYHPENPNAVDVVDRFNELQKPNQTLKYTLVLPQQLQRIY